MSEIEPDQEIYWVRTNVDGIVTAALLERAFSKQELAYELEDMKSQGPIRRILASRVTIGDQLKLAVKHPTPIEGRGER